MDDENVTTEGGGGYPCLKVGNKAMKNVESRCSCDALYQLASFISHLVLHMRTVTVFRVTYTSSIGGQCLAMYHDVEQSDQLGLYNARKRHSLRNLSILPYFLIWYLEKA